MGSDAGSTPSALNASEETGTPTTTTGRRRVLNWALSIVVVVLLAFIVYVLIASFNYPAKACLLAAAANVTAPAARPPENYTLPAGCPGASSGATIKINQLQNLGTHNSYKITPKVPVHPELKYSHEPLAVQLAHAGMRHFEIDLHPSSTDSHVFRVYHLPAIDHASTCECLASCLAEMKKWSDVTMAGVHTPLYVMFEYKMTFFEDAATSRKGVTTDQLLAIEDQLVQSWGRERIITPADVQGSYPTLRDAVTNGSWPSVDASLGKIVFLLMDRYVE